MIPFCFRYGQFWGFGLFGKSVEGVSKAGLQDIKQKIRVNKERGKGTGVKEKKIMLVRDVVKSSYKKVLLGRH